MAVLTPYGMLTRGEFKVRISGCARVVAFLQTQIAGVINSLNREGAGVNENRGVK